MQRTFTIPSAKSTSVWIATAEMPGSTPLTGNVETDVCIVGAGIAGLTTGYLLSKAGKRVVILDDGPLASGMTQVTTAHLSNAVARFVEVERCHGEEGATPRGGKSRGGDRLHRINFQRAQDRLRFPATRWLFVPAPGDEKELLEKELAAAHRAGVTGAEIVDAFTLRFIRSWSGDPLSKSGGALHPLKYLAAVAEAIKERKAGGFSPIATPTALKAARQEK